MLKQAHQVLEEHFGYSKFRPQQEEIIANVLAKKDTLVLMPTGGGKSICFQIPALLFDGVAIVISPLISLMKDQVESLRANGISAAYYNSSLDPIEERQVVNDAIDGEIKLLYVSPEKLFTITNTWLKDVKVSMFAVDEAHCVSMWGHDFRPEYTQLSNVRKQFSSVPFIALTATADKSTRKDIVTQLGLNQATVYLSSFNRPNLSLEVRANVPKQKKIKEIVSFIENRPNQSGIIYCLSRKQTEEIAKELRAKNIEAKAYHAGLSSDVRARIQEDFITDDLSIITATIAFGMGIDKSNVRWVIHNNLPKNIEGYYQEIGRAGRDGLPSTTRMYFNLKDLMVLKRFATGSEQSPVYTEKLQRMLNYAEATSCRRKILLAYFSEDLKVDCGNCDVCKNPPQFLDGTILAQKALSAVRRTNEDIGVNMMINILRGSANQEVYNKGYQNIKTYGIGKDLSFQDWQHYTNQLINIGVMEIAYDESFKLKITTFGNEVLFRNRKVKITQAVDRVFKSKEKKIKAKKLTKQDAFFEELRKLRASMAKKEGVPAYIIFHDATLQQIAAELPTSENDLLTIQGINQIKIDRYAAPFLALIEKHNENKLSTFEVTYRFYQQGISPEQIAEERQLSMTTIFSHLAKLYTDGKDIDLSIYINDDEVQKVREAFLKIKSTNSLKPYFDYLEAKVPYYKIRLGLTIIMKELVKV